MSKVIEPVRISKYTNRRLSVFDQNLSLPRHRWYTFKEGFSEELVTEAIKDACNQAGKKLNILDPFSGSGTTLVASGRTNHRATGIDVNPFLAFASRAKCVPGGWNRSDFEIALSRLLESSSHEVLSSLEGQSTFTQRNGLEKWLFNRSVLRGFTAIDKALDKESAWYDPLRLALIASLMECCNAKRDGKCLRYRKGWRSLGLTSTDLRAIFELRAEQVVDDVLGHSFSAEGIQVIEGDARVCLKALTPETFDLIVTSPPYLNSLDYSDVYRPELFAGGFVRSNKELRKIRLETVRSHVQVAWDASETVSSPLLPPIVGHLTEQKLWDDRLPLMVQSYFSDMATVLREASRLMKPGGKAWIVVSTSAYGGIEIPVDLILADVGTRNGWQLLAVYVLRQLRTSAQQWNELQAGDRKPLRESLIVLQR